MLAKMIVQGLAAAAVIAASAALYLAAGAHERQDGVPLLGAAPAQEGRLVDRQPNVANGYIVPPPGMLADDHDDDDDHRFEDRRRKFRPDGRRTHDHDHDDD